MDIYGILMDQIYDGIIKMGYMIYLGIKYNIWDIYIYDMYIYVIYIYDIYIYNRNYNGITCGIINIIYIYDIYIWYLWNNNGIWMGYWYIIFME